MNGLKEKYKNPDWNSISPGIQLFQMSGYSDRAFGNDRNHFGNDEFLRCK